jgi:hypothetical protein
MTDAITIIIGCIAFALFMLFTVGAWAVGVTTILGWILT